MRSSIARLASSIQRRPPSGSSSSDSPIEAASSEPPPVASPGASVGIASRSSERSSDFERPASSPSSIEADSAPEPPSIGSTPSRQRVGGDERPGINRDALSVSTATRCRYRRRYMVQNEHGAFVARSHGEGQAMSDRLSNAEAAVLRAMRTIETPAGEARASLRDLAVLAGTSLGGVRDPLSSLVRRGVLFPTRPRPDASRCSVWRIVGFRGRWRRRARSERSAIDSPSAGVTLVERWPGSDEQLERPRDRR